LGSGKRWATFLGFAREKVEREGVCLAGYTGEAVEITGEWWAEIFGVKVG
jgi:hypothetical protein